jgi:DNA (cytosine-5)-methyltransferase 1
MVAITQTSILGKQGRRISTREGMRLQGLPEWFDFLDQAPSKTFKQLGNGVNIAAVYNVMKALVIRDLDLLGKDTDLVQTILTSDNSPDNYLRSYHGSTQANWQSESTTAALELKILKNNKNNA